METKNPLITRRDFMRGATYGALGAVIGWQGLEALETSGARPFASTEAGAGRVVLVRDRGAVDDAGVVDAAAVAAMIDRAVLELAGEKDVLKAWGTYFRPEDTVGVKFTRCGWMRHHTEQAVIDAVVARLKDVGVAPDRIHAADGGLPVKKCTALIDVPSVKIHSLTGIACAIKNYINFTGRESSYHGAGNAKLAESFFLPDIKGKTRLVIVDFLKPYFGPGPQINPLHRWSYKGVLATTDPVAADATALRICQVQRDKFKGEPWPVSPPPVFLAAAEKEFKLGISDPARINVVKLGWDEDLLI